MLHFVVLAAGQGTRMKSRLPKVLHPVGGLPMIAHVLKTAASLTSLPPTVVLSPDLQNSLKNSSYSFHPVLQELPLGTGDAALKALSALPSDAEEVGILYGDMPLILPETLKRALEIKNKQEIVILAMRPDDPGHYGRVIVNPEGYTDRIVEFKDATHEERLVPLCHSGVLLASRPILEAFLPNLSKSPQTGECYLTDLIALACSQGIKTKVFEVPAQEVMGVNNRWELAQAEQAFQQLQRYRACLDGVTLTDPSSVHFYHDTQWACDVEIGPHVVFGPGVVLEEGAIIKGYCYLTDTCIKSGASVGPFAHLRGGSTLAEGCVVGNFVELKGTYLGAGTKAKHLSYLGNATIGEKVTIGAGTITCNYDGFRKEMTIIEDEVFVGSQTALVSPVTLKKGCMIAAGSVITQSVESGHLAITRTRQKIKEGWAAAFRSKNQKKV